MNSPENQDWERKLQELEAEINQEPTLSPVRQADPPSSQQMNNVFNSIKDWYNSLPTPGRVGVVIVGVIVVFSLLNTVLRLVASLLSVTILAIVLYLLYKFLNNRR